MRAAAGLFVGDFRSSSEFHLDDAEDAQFIALDVDGHVTVIAAEALTGPDPEDPQVDWDGFLAELTALTDSMVITPA